MTLEITPNINIQRDDNNRIRQLDQSWEPYESQTSELRDRLTAEGASYQDLAAEYLREVGEHFEFGEEMLSNLTEPVSAGLTSEEGPNINPQEGIRLKVSEDKQVSNLATVAYKETCYGLPVWEATVAVQINADNSQVIGATNGVDYDLQVTLPNLGAAPYAPERITPSVLKDLLGLSDSSEELIISGKSLLIYKYFAEERQIFPQPQEQSHSFYESGLPILPLPPVGGERIEDGTYYVVVEVLFRLRLSNQGEHNWTALIEPESGSVLYLRPHVSGVSGYCYSSDPVTNGCPLCKGSSPTSKLDSYRTLLPLEGLVPPSDGKPQSLEGEYVQLKKLNQPNVQYPHQLPTKPVGEDFVFSVPTDDFAAVAAYYTCDFVFRLIADLKIDVHTYFKGTKFPVPVDPYYKFSYTWDPKFKRRVNAEAKGNTTSNGLGELRLGLAQSGTKTSIAATPRVLLHEFGHALLWNHVNSPNFGFAHSAGDAMAAILMDPNYMKDRDKIDRGLTFPFMANGNASAKERRHDRKVSDGWAWFGKNYQKDASKYSGYRTEQVLSTTLFRLYCCTGGNSEFEVYQRFASLYTFYLIVKGIGLLTATTRDPAVYVDALEKADRTTTDFQRQVGGTSHKVIRWSFEKQGLFQPPRTPKPYTKPGAPPDIDVYIDDGRHGEYDWTDQWLSDDIWNRHQADGGSSNEAPTANTTNYLYVKIKNRGTKAATNIRVRGFQSAPGASGHDWPNDWVAMDTPEINHPGTIASRSEVTVGPLQWKPQAGNTSVLIIVTADGDLSIVDNPNIQGETIPHWRLVPFDNNIAQRDFSV